MTLKDNLNVTLAKNVPDTESGTDTLDTVHLRLKGSI